MPLLSESAMSRERLTTAFMSGLALLTAMPKVLALCSMVCMTSADLSRALVGMQPQFKQMPP